MKVLLLEEDLIVKKDIELQLRRSGIEVTSDHVSGGYDRIIIGQLFYLEKLRGSFPAITLHAPPIFFITSIERAALRKFYTYTDPAILLKPAQVELLLSLLQA